MSNAFIERLTRAAAEADGQVWDGLSCKDIYANMVGAVLSELVAVGFIFNAADERDLVIRELIEKALGSEADNYKAYDGYVAEWLRAQAKGIE